MKDKQSLNPISSVPPRRVLPPRTCRLASIPKSPSPDAQQVPRPVDGISQVLSTPQGGSFYLPLPESPQPSTPRSAMASLLSLLAQHSAQVPDSNLLHVTSRVFYYLYTYSNGD